MPSKQQAAKEAAKVILPPERVDPAVWQGKPPCSQMDELRWIVENHDEEPTPEASPSKFAWKFLKLVKPHLDKFMVEVSRGIIKSAENERSLAGVERFTAQMSTNIDRKLEALLDEAFAETDAATAEDADGESPLAEGDAAHGGDGPGPATRPVADLPE
jgi:hypothetical protein